MQMRLSLLLAVLITSASCGHISTPTNPSPFPTSSNATVLIVAGATTFQSPDSFAYHWMIHPNMVGTVVVQ